MQHHLTGLSKLLSKQGKAFICTAEGYDIMNKMLKNDEESGSRECQLLCKLLSGEKCSYVFSTENTREIAADTPFSILIGTQVGNAAKLVTRMQTGNGLIDRFIVTLPLCKRPLPTRQQQRVWIKSWRKKSMTCQTCT